MKIRPISVALTLVILALVTLIGLLALRQGEKMSAPPPVILSDDDRTEAERIIRARINSLSPVPPKLGGKFSVQEIEWDDRGTALVTYGDGESTLEGNATVMTGSGRLKIGGFEVGE